MTTSAQPAITRATLEAAASIAGSERGIAVVSTLHPSGAIHSSVVNVAVIDHPFDDSPVLAFVTYGRVKIANLRHNRQIAVTFRHGIRWATIEGRAELVGPDNRSHALHPGEQRLLFRNIFTAAGGTHDNWDEYDRVMREQQRVAVLVHPDRHYHS